MSEKDAMDAILDGRLRAEGEALRVQRAECPPPDLLLARASDVLETTTRQVIAAHLAACSACARLVADLEAVEPVGHDLALARVWDRVGAPARATQGSRRWLPVAAVVAVAAGAGALWTLGRPARESMTQSATAASRPAPAPEASTAALWTVEPAPVRVSAAALGQTRDGAAPARTADLLDALGGYRQGRYSESVAPLESLVRARPADMDAAFYLGVTYLLADRPAEAATVLERARSLSPAHRFAETDWYLAAAAQRAGHVDVARAALDRLCSGESRFKAQACAARPQLR